MLFVRDNSDIEDCFKNCLACASLRTKGSLSMEMLNISTSERPLMLQEASPDPGSRHRELCRAGTAPGEKKPGFHTSSMLSWPSCSATTRELAHLISSPFQASVEATVQISKAPRSIHSHPLHRNRHRHRQICQTQMPSFCSLPIFWQWLAFLLTSPMTRKPLPNFSQSVSNKKLLLDGKCFCLQLNLTVPCFPTLQSGSSNTVDP